MLVERYGKIPSRGEKDIKRAIKAGVSLYTN
jgi:hypothetical protein